MKILFIHQNFPTQFIHLAPALARMGHAVKAFSYERYCPTPWEGIDIIFPDLPSIPGLDIHPWLKTLQDQVSHGEGIFRAAQNLKETGYNPDLVIAHPGWGDSLFVKDVWPQSRLAIYCEYFYRTDNSDVNFDLEFPMLEPGLACHVRMKNANYYLHFPLADAAISPTHWQAQTFPEPLRSHIRVIHDGIDTTTLAPNPHASITLNGNTILTPQDEVITFINRNLEPYRGYHIFMRALPEILRRRKNAHVIIVGGGDVSYGAPPPEGESWRTLFAAEVRDDISDEDWSRIFFVDKVDYALFIGILQVSTVHVYLTYPFVLSWSLMQAMSVGCAVVASNTAPVQEVVVDGETGLLCDFFDKVALCDKVCTLLADPKLRGKIGAAARAHILAHYDLHSICLPQQIQWIEDILRDI